MQQNTNNISGSITSSTPGSAYHLIIEAPYNNNYSTLKSIINSSLFQTDYSSEYKYIVPTVSTVLTNPCAFVKGVSTIGYNSMLPYVNTKYGTTNYIFSAIWLE